MAVDYGSDISCVEDLDPWIRVVDGPVAVAQAVARRWITPLGGLVGSPEYGAGLSTFLNSSGPPIPQIRAALRNQALAEERVLGIELDLTYAEEVLTVRASLELATGPFEFVLRVDEYAAKLEIEGVPEWGISAHAQAVAPGPRLTTIPEYYTTYTQWAWELTPGMYETPIDSGGDEVVFRVYTSVNRGLAAVGDLRSPNYDAAPIHLSTGGPKGRPCMSWQTDVGYSGTEPYAPMFTYSGGRWMIAMIVKPGPVVLNRNIISVRGNSGLYDALTSHYATGTLTYARNGGSVLTGLPWVVGEWHFVVFGVDNGVSMSLRNGAQELTGPATVVSNYAGLAPKVMLGFHSSVALMDVAAAWFVRDQWRMDDDVVATLAPWLKEVYGVEV